MSPNSLATGLEVFKIRFDLFLIVGFFRMNTKAYQNSPTETFPYKSVTGTTRTHQRRALRNHRSPPGHSQSQRRRPRVVRPCLLHDLCHQAWRNYKTQAAQHLRFKLQFFQTHSSNFIVIQTQKCCRMLTMNLL